MQPEFREALLGLISNEEERARITQTSQDRDFVLALAEQYRTETGSLLVQAYGSSDPDNSEPYKRFAAILDKFIALGGPPAPQTANGNQPQGGADAMADEANAVAYAEFAFLTDTFSNPAIFERGVAWLESATTTNKWPVNQELRYILVTYLYLAAPGRLAPLLRLGTTNSAQKVLRDLLLHGPDDLVDLYAKYIGLREQYQSKLPETYREWVNTQLRPLVSHDPGVAELAMFESLYFAFLAEQYEILDLLSDAEAMIDRALTLWPGNPYALALRGQIGLSLKRESQAVHDFRAAIRIGRKLGAAFEFLGGKAQVYAHVGLAYYHYEKKEFDQAIAHSDDALKLKPDEYFKAVILLNRARDEIEARLLNDARTALAEVERTIENLERVGLPENNLRSKVHLNLGLIWHRQGIDRRAESEYEKAIGLESDLAEAYNNLAIVYAGEGKTERAEKLFETALEKDPELSEARANLAQIGKSAQSGWWGWWFGSGAVVMLGRKIFGLALLLALLFQLWLCFRLSLRGQAIPPANLIVAGVIGLVLVLPMVQKLKVGGVEVGLKSESIGQHPVSE